MATMESYINEWVRGIRDPLIHEALMSDPVEACQHADCVEEYQWAIQHWYHADVCVIEEIGMDNHTPYFSVVLEFWKKDEQGNPVYTTTRLSLSPKELLGMYRYYKEFSNQ